MWAKQAKHGRHETVVLVQITEYSGVPIEEWVGGINLSVVSLYLFVTLQSLAHNQTGWNIRGIKGIQTCVGAVLSTPRLRGPQPLHDPSVS